MNKVTLVGRTVRTPELKYGQEANPVAVCNFVSAVRRLFTRQGEADADFFNCVAFGKLGENIAKYTGKAS